MRLPPIVALEIGTSKVVALVGEMREDGHILITGAGEHPSVGVRKGEITDLENAAICVRAVLSAASESGNVMIRQVHMAVSGGHMQSQIGRGSTAVLDKDGEITPDDVEEVMNVARAIPLPPDREILHTICQHFCIDDQERVVRPEGMEGAKLSLDMLILHVVRNRLRNTVRVVRSVPVEVADVAFSGLCSALAVLTPEQKKSGAVLVDIGGGTTDYVAYADNVVATAGSFGVGGDHVTNDIAQAFKIPLSQAENLKRQSGSAVIEAAGASQRVTLAPEDGFVGRSVSLRSLHAVVNARLDEILLMVRKVLEKERLLHGIGAGVVLTGGVARQKGIVKLAERVFGLPCAVGRPRHVSGQVTATESPEYAACVGMVQYGFKTAMERTPSEGAMGWLRDKLFRR